MPFTLAYPFQKKYIYIYGLIFFVPLLSIKKRPYALLKIPELSSALLEYVFLLECKKINTSLPSLPATIAASQFAYLYYSLKLCTLSQLKVQAMGHTNKS